ncbi:hypothetical protein TNCV_5096591 [Trichonephila clavipes]|nr:hypothetical protein TNCV_5096591 [Trichonephila clavipes]
MASLAVGVAAQTNFLSQCLNAPFVIQGQFSLAHSFSQDRVVVYSASPPQVWGSINGLRKVDSAFYHRYIGSINEYQACLGSQTLKVSLQTDHQIGTSVHAPQRPMVTCIMMGTVVPGPHGLLCF